MRPRRVNPNPVCDGTTAEERTIPPFPRQSPPNMRAWLRIPSRAQETDRSTMTVALHGKSKTRQRSPRQRPGKEIVHYPRIECLALTK